MNVHAQTQNCPRVMQTGDRIFTDPAGQYRWLDADGNPIPNAHQADFIPSGEGRFAVEVSGISMPYRFDPNGNKPKILKGKALDFFLKPIADAQITLQGKTVQTDARGEFFLPFNATLGRREAVRCNKNGFYTSIRGFHPTDAETLYTQFILSERKVNFTYDAKDGGIFSQPGVWIKLPANGYVDESGKRYKGKVNLSYRSARPGDAHFGALMPGGDFLALNANGQTRALESYGFTEVLLADESGNALQLAPGVTAQLRFLIPEGLRDKAPETMPLWYMNENEGIWREEGAVQKDGLFYTGTVSHFTPWGANGIYPPAFIKGKAKNCTGKTVPYAYVENKGRGLSCGTDSEGTFMFIVPVIDTFRVYSQLDSIIGIAPLLNDTLILRDLLVGKPINAQSFVISDGITDSLKVIIPDALQPIYVSLDNGQTYQNQLEFDITSIQVENRPSEIKVVFGSEKCDTLNLNVYYLTKNQDCVYIDYDVNQYIDRNFLLNSSSSFIRKGMYPFDQRIFNGDPRYEIRNWNPRSSNEIYTRLSTGSCLRVLEFSFGDTLYPPPPDVLNNLTELFIHSDSSNYFALDTQKERFMSWFNLPALNHLSIDNVTVYGGTPDIFAGMKSLTKLSISWPIINLVAGATLIPNLETLCLSGYGNINGWESDNDTVFNLFLQKQKLKRLAIYNTTGRSWEESGCIKFPTSNANINSSLEELDIRNTDSVHLRSNISQIVNLKKLSLVGCSISIFPGSITLISNLEFLDLSSKDSIFEAHLTYPNAITSIPPTISALSGTLKELILTGNPIPENERATIQSWLPNTRITW